MIAILGGLVAAMIWAAGNIASARAARAIGPLSSVAWVMAIGLAINLPLALATTPVPAVGPGLLPYLLVSGGGNVLGLVLFYRGLRLGKIGIVSAITSTEGAVGAVVAIVTGEALSALAIAVLAAIATSVAWVALVSGRDETDPTSRRPVDPAHATRAAVHAILAAMSFGTALYATGRVSASLPVAWAILSARVMGTGLVFLPLLLSGRLRLTRAVVPFVTANAVAEVVGTLVYALGARESIAVTAVLASQFGAIGSVFAWVLYRERLSVRQRSGVIAIALGVAALAVLRA